MEIDIRRWINFWRFAERAREDLKIIFHLEFHFKAKVDFAPFYLAISPRRRRRRQSNEWN